MIKPISPAAHGALDYATAAGAALAPALMKFPTRAAALAYGIAGTTLGLAAFTDFRPALKRAVPLKAHGITDGVVGMVLPALPWVLGFARHRKARNFFLGLTVLMTVATVLTDWSPRRSTRRGGAGRRRG
jgi:hypothetical protein